MAELFEVHDRSKVEIFAYYCGPESSDGLNTRIRAAVEHFTDIRPMSDDEAAQRIADDGIDILVDVNGHTRDARTSVFARRPAPIIVNWLGYPGTMGSDYHHYIIADPWIIPPEMELYYSEAVRRIPCYQPNDRRRKVEEKAPTRAEAGLLLAGLPGGESAEHNFLSKRTREMLGLKVAEAAAALPTLRQLSLSRRLYFLGLAMPKRPASM